MTSLRGRTVAAGILCAVAGTIALWCGPLAAATGALHSGGQSTNTVHATTQTGGTGTGLQH
jgi:hypothetical protein